MSNEQKCYEYFKNNMGLNTAGACGIMANIKYESGFKPNIYGDGGTSYGICKNNYDYTSIEGQLHFLQYELENSYKSLTNYIKKVSNTSQGSYDAGYKFCYDFERPANKSTKSVQRGNYAKTYFNKYNGSGGNLTIKDIQSTLNSRYNTGLSVDGKYGSKTHKALVIGLQTEFNKQYKAGLNVDGVFGPKTKSKCPNVKEGAKGNIVWLIQAMLKCRGYSLSVDGSFGPDTKSKVIAFQKAHGLSQDGIVGKNTFEKLFK